MDREQFDAWTRWVATRGSRRAALGALLGSVLVGQAAMATGGKHHHKGKHHDDDGDDGPRSCYPGDTCVPGTARNNKGCDFSNSDVFVGLAAQSSNLSGSNFTNADLRGADLRAVNLSDSCLVD